MKTIFLTGGGGSGTIAITKALKKLGKYRVILGDMDKWAAGLRFADKSYILPAGKDDKFLDRIRNIIRAEKVDIFVPLVDEEILESYELKKDFPDLMILLPEYDFAKIALDKWELMNKLTEKDISCPKTYLGNRHYHDLEYPFIVKPRVGRGSKNVREINSQKELQAYKVLSGLNDNEILLQEKIIGTEYTVSVVVNYFGEVLAIVPKEVIYKKGITIVAVTRKNKAIEDICRKVQFELQANGAFNVQLILKDNGEPVIFEINPRFSTTIALTTEAGVNEIDILVENYLHSKGILPYKFKESLVMSRYYEQIYWEE